MRVLALMLRKHRRNQNLSQAKLAEIAGITRKQLNCLESGQAKDCAYSTFKKLCRALGVSPNELAGYEWEGSVTPEFSAKNAREYMSDRTCSVCGAFVPAGTGHRPAKCVADMFYAGVRVSEIARRWNWTINMVEAALQNHNGSDNRGF
jgi:DNA-binding Xre family transcriptional regulator